jgi:DNA-binding phage protein
MTMTTTCAHFDAAARLGSDETIAAYLTAPAEDTDPDVYPAAIGDIAKEAGLGRGEIPVRLTARLAWENVIA